MEAGSRGFGHIVEYLLKAGADVHAQTTRRETALAFAAANGCSDVAGRLLAARADANCWIDIGAGGAVRLSALTIASGRGHVDVVRKLLAAGAQPDGWNEKERPLVIAARNGHVEIVQLLLLGGANSNCRGVLNKTALSAAAAKGSCELCRLLLLAEAEPNNYDDYGMNSLSWACHMGHLKVAKLLVKNGADPLVQGAIETVSQKHGGTVLSWALKQKRRDVVMWLASLKVSFPQSELAEAKKLLAG